MDAFIEAAAHPTKTITQAAVEAGYAESNAAPQASRLMAYPEVRAAVADRRTQRQIEAGIDTARVWRQLDKYVMDSAPNVRPAAIQAAREILRGASEVGPDVNIQVDARTPLLTSEFYALTPDDTAGFLAWLKVNEPPTPQSLESLILDYRAGQLAAELAAIPAEFVEDSR